ncbi:MAG: hypothetical protein WCN97_10780 [Thermoleophilia bacterium]
MRRLTRGALVGVLLLAAVVGPAAAADLPRVTWGVEMPGGLNPLNPSPITLVPDGSIAVSGRTNASGRAVVTSVGANATLIGSVALGDAWSSVVAVRSTTTEAPAYGAWAVSSSFPIRIAAIDPSRPARMGSDIVLSEAYGSAVDAVITPPAAKKAPRLYIITNTEPASLVTVDLTTRRVVDSGSLDGGRRADAIAISPDGTRLIIAHSAIGASGAAPAITTYDTVTLGPDEGDIAIPGGMPAMAIVTSPDGALAYLSQIGGQGVAKVDLAARRGAGTSNTVGNNWSAVKGGLGIAPDGSELVYAGAATGVLSPTTMVWRLGSSPLRLLPSTSIVGNGGALVVDAGGVHAYVATGSQTTSQISQVQIAPEPRRLTVRIAGRGGGLVDATPGGLLCGKGLDCVGTYPDGAKVQLVATPNPGTVFTGWSGGCTGTDDDCLVTMNGAQTVMATFAPAPSGRRTVTFGVAGGSGTVRSSLLADACSSVCSTSAWRGVTMTLTAVPADGSAFVRWDGACSGTVASCSLTVNGELVATAVFAKIPEPDPTPPAPDPTPPAPTPTPDVPFVTPVPGPNPPGPNGDVPAPLVLSNLSISRATVIPGQGAIVRYRLSRSARVRMTFVLEKNPKQRYVYTIPAGRAGADAGANRVHLSARVKGRNVRPGRWLMTVEAIGENNQRAVAKRAVAVRPGR